jgi:hypothetical protein
MSIALSIFQRIAGRLATVRATRQATPAGLAIALNGAGTSTAFKSTRRQIRRQLHGETAQTPSNLM